MFAAGHQGHTVGHWALCLRAKCKKRKYNYTLNKKKLSYGQQNTVQVKQVVPPSQCLQPHCWCLHEWQQRHGALSNTSNFKKAGYSELSLVRNCSLTLRHREQTLLSTGEKTSTYRQQAEERPAYPVFIQKIEVTYWILVFQSDEFFLLLHCRSWQVDTLMLGGGGWQQRADRRNTGRFIRYEAAGE